MAHVNNPTIFRLVGIIMIVLAILNVYSNLALFASRAPVADSDDVVETEGNPVEDTAQAIGGMNSIMGVMTLVHAPLLAAVGVALLLLRRWEMFAAIALVIDIFIRVGNILGQLAVGDTLGDLMLPLLLAVVDVVAIVLIVREWNGRRHPDAVRTVERAT